MATRTEAETKLIYHGVKFYEMANYFEQSIEEEKIRLKAYFVEHGLDPETGEELSAKKLKKSRSKAIKHGKSPTKAPKTEKP